jgi:diguanylate cyclase (GGDEF)-like protein/PAS domain S-box-containing protein
MIAATSSLFRNFRMARMFRMRPATRISLGLTALMVTCLLALDILFGVMPDQNALIRQLRERISENVAAHTVTLMESGNIKMLGKDLREAMEREPQLLSIAVRRVDNQIVAQAGEHAKHWLLLEGGRSDLDHVRVPLLVNGQRWGDVELSFQSTTPRTVREWLREPTIFLVIMLGLCSFLVFSIYLRRVLDYLDPSAVIPDRVRKAFDGFTEGVMVIDTTGQIVMANDAFRQLVGSANTSLFGKRIENIPSFKSTLPADPKDHPWMRAMAQGSVLKGESVTFSLEQGEAVKTVVNCAPIHDAPGKVRGCIVTFDNVTEVERINRELRETMADLERSRQQIEKQNEELVKLATRDPLTGCLNRRAFRERLDEIFASARASGQPLSCIMTDVDHFKSFNDTYGHAVGDQVLRVVTRNLASGVRDIDLLGRYGGEEFCIVLPEVDLEQACHIAERLRAEIHSRAGKSIRNIQGVTISSSFGVSTLRPDVADPAELIERADQAMYAAKQAGRNCVRSAPEKMAAK